MASTSDATPTSASSSKAGEKAKKSTDHGVAVPPSTKKDRIKTPAQFAEELERLMDINQQHKEKLGECKELNAKLRQQRTLCLPFLVNNLNQTRVNCSKYGMYLSSTVVQRKRKVTMEDLREIIREELGPASLERIDAKAQERREQKVAMRQTRIMPISNKRAEKRKAAAQESEASQNKRKK